MIVADNTLAHDPMAVEELIRFYNGLDQQKPEFGEYVRRHREVAAFDQRLKERDGGDAEFRTKRWLLEAMLEHPCDCAMFRAGNP